MSMCMCLYLYELVSPQIVCICLCICAYVYLWHANIKLVSLAHMHVTKVQNLKVVLHLCPCVSMCPFVCVYLYCVCVW